MKQVAGTTPVDLAQFRELPFRPVRLRPDKSTQAQLARGQRLRDSEAAAVSADRRREAGVDAGDATNGHTETSRDQVRRFEADLLHFVENSQTRPAHSIREQSRSQTRSRAA